MDISIVIPVFNTPTTALKRCLESIKWSKVSYEIIIIDDGSNSDLIEEYNELLKKLKLNNIRIYFQKNHGVSYTRNKGIKLAKGNYIFFIDSDDYLLDNDIDYKLLKKDYDIIIYNYDILQKNNIIKYKELSANTGKINYIDVIRDFVENSKCYSPVAKLIKRKFLIENKILFDETLINGEDAVFNLNMLTHEPTIYYSDKDIYLYDFDVSNYEKRLKNNFDVTIKNYLHKHDIKKQVIKKYNLDNNLWAKIDNDAVNQMFRICMICSNLKLKKLNEIIYYLNLFKINKSNLLLKNKIKYYIISGKHGLTINLISKVRTIYLKIRK